MTRQYFTDAINTAARAVKRAAFFDICFRVVSFGILSNKKSLDLAKAELVRQENNLLRYDRVGAELRSEDSQILDEIEGVRLSRHGFEGVQVIAPGTYGPAWDAVRHAVLQRDSFQCQESDGFCAGPLHVHHIVPLSKGGTNDSRNLETLCEYHHTLRHPHMRLPQRGNIRR